MVEKGLSFRYKIFMVRNIIPTYFMIRMLFYDNGMTKNDFFASSFVITYG